MTFEDVSVTTTGLTWTAGDDGVETTGGELFVDMLFNLGDNGTFGLLTGDVIGDLWHGGFTGGNKLLLTLTQNLTVMVFPPLSEWCGIDLNNGSLDQSLGTDQLVVGGVVNNVDQTGLSGDAFRAPGEITGVETEGTVLVVATTDTN